MLVFGESEVRFLEALDAGRARRGDPAACSRTRIPCLVVTAGFHPPPESLDEADRAQRAAAANARRDAARDVAARRTRSTSTSPRARVVHGVLMDILGLGVLIIGESGIGKSECALDLVVRGHRLVADDAVELRARAESFLIGTCPELTRHHMEIRGLGLINVQDLFGVASTRTSKRVELVVQLERWEPAREYDRLGLDEAHYETARRARPDAADAGGAGAQSRDPRGGGGAQPAAAQRRPPRRAAARRAARRGSSAGAAAGRRRVGDDSDAKANRKRDLRRAASDARSEMREKRHAARRAARTAVASRFVVLTGLSGSGKSQAIRALEDLGYFCVDNLPVALLPMLAELTLRAGNEIARAAVVVDVREGKMLDEVPRIYRRLKGMRNLASRADLPRRVRRRRWSGGSARPGGRIRWRPIARRSRASAKSASAMKPLRRLADHIVDTSAMTVHELRHAFTERRGRPLARLAAGRHDPQLRVQARHPGGFGSAVRRPVPAEPALRAEAAAAHRARPRGAARSWTSPSATHEFLEHTLNLLKFLIPQYVAEGKSYLTIGIGCTGGRHRSVMIAEALKKGLVGLKGVQPRVRHRRYRH